MNFQKESPELSKISSRKQNNKAKKRVRNKDKEDSNRSKRMKSLEDVDGEPQGEGSDNELRPQKELSDFEQMFERIKSSRKRNKTEKSELEVEATVETFILKMDVAAEEDVNSNKQKEPALNKLKMLPEVAGQLRKKKLQQLFIENSLLLWNFKISNLTRRQRS